MTDLNELFKVIAEGKKHYEETDPVGKKIKEAKDHVKEDLSGLFAQLITLKEDLEKELVVEEAKLEQPMITEEIPAQPVIHTPEVRAAQVDADVDKYLTDKSFQQPNPDLVTKNIDDIRNKIKFLEQAIGRVAAAGPGGGEVNLRYLDDVDRSTITDGWYLRYSATKKKFEFAEVISSGGNGATGPAGATGVTGSSGAQGASGLNGSTGPTGASGAAGINGATGTQGASGSVGASGVYTSTETLDSVTTRGNTTDNEITVSALNIPNGATGASGINNIVSAQSSIIANISNEELNAVVEYGNSAALSIGDYGLPFGITGVPYVVYELKDTPSPALQIDDVVGGAYIPVGSKLLYVGSGTYSKIIITDKNFASGALLPVQNTVLVFARETVNQGLSILTPDNTDITINPGAGGHIVPHADIIPYTTNEWSLGSPAKRFKEVWLGTGTIYVQDETLGNDQALGAKDGNFYIKGGAGFEVGEWTLRDNYIHIKDAARNVNIGELADTGNVTFNRELHVQTLGSFNSFSVTREGLTTITVPTALDPTKAAFNIIGSSGSVQQPRNFSGTLVQLTAQNNNNARISLDSFGTGVYGTLAPRTARGTAANPTQTKAGDILGRITSQGWTITDTTITSFTSKTGSGPYLVTFAIPTQGIAPYLTSAVGSVTYTVTGNSNTAYNGTFNCTASTTNSITLSYATDPGAYGTGTTTLVSNGFFQGSIVRIDQVATQDFTTTGIGTKIQFQTTPINSTTAVVSTNINSTGLTFETTSADKGITFYDSTRLTYFPTQVGQDGKYLKVTNVGGQDLMSWEPVAAAGSGATGAQGASGIQGASGTNGTNGATGISGASGSQGIQGASGATGIAGTNGATGAQGASGVNGSTGAQGASGVYTINTVLVTTSTYTVASNDYYIGINRAGTVTITLTTPSNGTRLIIKDESGNCSIYPITVLGTVDNDADGFILQTDNGAIELIYRSGWRII